VKDWWNVFERHECFERGGRLPRIFNFVARRAVAIGSESKGVAFRRGRRRTRRCITAAVTKRNFTGIAREIYIRKTH
jgi:hypothetical protein